MTIARLFAAFPIIIAATAARAELVTKTIEYRQGDTVMEGYLAYDSAGQARKPGVVIFHQWMGITGHEKKKAEELAALGYVAFAADVYGKGVRPADPKAAGAEAGKYKDNRPLLRARAQAALATLRAQPNVQTDRVAATGYCFGGGAALELARSGADVRGVVTFHGSLDTPTPQDARNIKGKVLVLHGAADPFVPRAAVLALEDELDAAKVDYQVVLYAGAVHSFTQPEAGNDPSKGAAYDPRADRRSWQAMKDFLAEVLGQG